MKHKIKITFPNVLPFGLWLAEIRYIAPEWGYARFGHIQEDIRAEDWIEFWEDGLLPIEAIKEDLNNA